MSLSVRLVKPRLHVGHFYLHWQHNTSDVARIVKPECCTCSQGQVLQQNRWDNVAEYSYIIFICNTFCNMLQILGTRGYTSNRLQNEQFS